MLEEIQAKYPSSTSAPFNNMETAMYQIESAMYGVPPHAPVDVTCAVKKILASGQQAIPVHWKPLLGQDPRKDVLKFLTVTFSLTRSEGKELFAPTIEQGARLGARR
jgi:hypothetical protein